MGQSVGRDAEILRADAVRSQRGAGLLDAFVDTTDVPVRSRDRRLKFDAGEPSSRAKPLDYTAIPPEGHAVEKPPSRALPLSSPVRRIDANADWSCGVWRDVLIVVWRGLTTEDKALTATSAMHALARTREQMGILVVAERDAVPPGSDTRPMFAAAMQACGEKIVGVAYVIPTDGFRGAVMRSAITGLSLLAGEPYTSKAFRTLTEAAEWVAPRFAVEMQSDLLAAAVEELRRAGLSR